MISDRFQKAFLRERGLDAPDGRPLCRYRCTDDEFRWLENNLAEIALRFVCRRDWMSGLCPAGDFPLLFCLFASEWWRRNHNGGPWAWHGVLEGAGLDPNHPRLDLYKRIVKPGLAFWRRSILTVGGDNFYLVTLACEGGLPLNLLHRQTSLRRYFSALLREFHVYGGRDVSNYDLAARKSEHLPRSLRQNVVYQISGELIGKIWSLQGRLTGTRPPVEELDAIEPGWRDELPLVVSDNTVRTLLNNLVTEALEIRNLLDREIRLVPFLESRGDKFRLGRRAILPPTLAAARLGELLSVRSEDVPSRLQLYLSFGSGERELLALVTRRTAGDDGQFAIEPYRRGNISGPRAVGDVRIQPVTGTVSYPAREIRGGGELSELPWVFARKDNERLVGDFAGEGSVQTKFPEALIAVPAGGEVVPGPGSSAREVGELEDAGRRVYIVSGDAVVWGDTGRSCIRTGAEREDAYEYLVQGLLLAAGPGDAPVYRGCPKLVCISAEGARRTIPEEEIRWRPRRIGGSVWMPISEDCLGDVTLCHAPGGEVRFLRHLAVVPRGALVQFLPDRGGRAGEVMLQGFHVNDVGIVPILGVECRIRREGTGTVSLALSTLSDLPGSVTIRIQWGHGREMELVVPYPARGGRFLTREGRPFRDGASVHVDRIGGIVAQTLVPSEESGFQVEADMRRGVPVSESDYSRWVWVRFALREVSPGRHEADLRDAEDVLRTMFTLTEDLDAEIEFRLLDRFNMPMGSRLRVARYEARFRADRDRGELMIVDRDGVVPLSNSEIEAVQVKAIPLRNPEAEPVMIRRPEPGLWLVEPSKMEPGPWLVTGWEHSWCRIRPEAWTIPKNDSAGDDSDAAGAGVSLQDAIRIEDDDERRAKIDQVLERLALNPDDSEWQLVQAFLDRTELLPPMTFDVVGRLAHNPDAAALALVRSEEDRFDGVWNELERLPFQWSLVPFCSWMRASSRYHEAMRRRLPALQQYLDKMEAEEMIRDATQSFCRRLAERARGMIPVAASIRHQLHGNPFPPEFAPVFEGEGGRSRVLNILKLTGVAMLRQAHADEQWPRVSGIQDWIREQVETPAGLDAFIDELLMEVPDHQRDVLLAPAVAAITAVIGASLSRGMIFQLRRLQDFDPVWFETAYGFFLAVGVGETMRLSEN